MLYGILKRTATFAAAAALIVGCARPPMILTVQAPTTARADASVNELDAAIETEVVAAAATLAAGADVVADADATFVEADDNITVLTASEAAALTDEIADTVVTYTCPMHSDVQTNEAGNCPTCDMDLIVNEAADATDEVATPPTPVVIVKLTQPRIEWLTDKGLQPWGIRVRREGSDVVVNSTVLRSVAEQLMKDSSVGNIEALAGMKLLDGDLFQRLNDLLPPVVVVEHVDEVDADEVDADEADADEVDADEADADEADADEADADEEFILGAIFPRTNDAGNLCFVISALHAETSKQFGLVIWGKGVRENIPASLAMIDLRSAAGLNAFDSSPIKGSRVSRGILEALHIQIVDISDDEETGSEV